MRRPLSGGLTVALIASLLSLVAPMASAQLERTPAAIPAREVEPVVMEGSQLSSWSRLAAVGQGRPYPSGAGRQTGTGPPPGADSVRDAHNGDLHVPPDGREGVPVDQIVAYRWDEESAAFAEIPVQVDERFPYFLANGRSNFSGYSGTDMELTYAWDDESWKKMFGECAARYALSAEEVQAALDAEQIGALGGSTLEEMLGPKADPVATLDDDDEIVFMASDAGAPAPEGAGPPGTIGGERQEIRLVDPRDPDNERFVYLFLKEEGSSFDPSNGYVDYERDENADEWIDRDTFTADDPEKLGSSNTGYGPNLPGTVCNDARGPTEPRSSTDRFVRDGVTVSTDSYQWYASGRWMVRSMRVAKPGTKGEYGPDLVDRWKGRAFQQSPDSSISLVGFEDEQVNWEANAALLGERTGPVRAIRETWGADSGTNVTKTETFYRDAINYRYRVRVHPIPPDGLYTSWDYNHDVADTYFNESRSEGVDIDGQNDEIFGNVDEAPNGQPAFFDAPDPRHTKPLAIFNWEQVSGAGDSGSLVYMFEMHNPHTSLQNPAVVPYYRDDACLDDGTGDDPKPRPWPGEDSTDPRVYPEQGEDYECISEDPTTWEHRQGCFGCHGIHYFFTGDTDNATVSAAPVTEIDGAQWQWAAPTAEPTNVGDRYANTVKTPLVAKAVVQPSEPQPDPTPTPTDDPDPTPSPTPTDDPDPTPTSTPTEDPGPTPSPTPTEDPDPTPSPTPTEDPEPAMPGCEATRDERRHIEGYIPVAQDDPKDATTLHYQVWFPDCEDTDGDGELDFAGPYHAVMDYSGYKPAIDIYDGLRDRFLSEGYAVVGLNIRGTACSGGYFDYFEPRQAEDGREAIDYLTDEPWSTGRLAMVGKSYPGITQLFVAGQPFEEGRPAGQPAVPLDPNASVETPEGLVALVPGHVFGDLYRDVPYPGGIQNSTFAGGWSAGRIYDMIFHGPGKATGTDYEFKIPEQEGEPDEQCLENQAQHAANPPLNPFVRAIYNHHDGELFFERSPWYWAHNIEVPTFLIEAWQDEQVGSRATELLERFDPELEVRFLGTNGDHGEYYGDHVLPEINRFLRYHLAQEIPESDQDDHESFDAAFDAYNAEPPVQINWETEGESNSRHDRTPRWKETYESWPPPSVNEEEPWRLNLTGDGLLVEEGTETTGPDSVEYDYVPGVGTQQRGGYKLNSRLPNETQASWEETPPDGTYAMFQTHTLEKDALLAGPASVDLWVSSTAPDTDFQVTMTEVRPDGKEVFVQQGWLRASHRNLIEHSLATPIDSRGVEDWSTPLRPFQSHRAEDSLPLTPGQPTQARIEIFPFAHAFREGSAIRIYVEAPHIKPDLWGFALLPAPARNTIHTGGGFESSLALPLLEGATAPTEAPDCNDHHVHAPLRNQPCRAAIEPLPSDAPEPDPDPTPTPTPTTSPSPSPSATANPSPASSASPSPDPSASPPPGTPPSPGTTPSPDPSAPPTTGPPPDPPPAEPNRVSTTIEANRTKVVAKSKVMLSGMVLAPEECPGPHEVSILARRHGTTNYREIARVVSADGTWKRRIKAKRNSGFVARPLTSGDCEPVSSAPVDVMVKVKIKARVPNCERNGKVRGRVIPNQRRTSVILQRKRPGKWRWVDRDRLNKRSRFAFDLPSCGGRYRVKWPKQNAMNQPNRRAFRP